MATLTKSELEALAKSYVDSSKAGSSTFTPDTDSFTNCIGKIGKMVTLYLPQVNELPELKGENLPFGQTIEEFMVNDFLPTEYTYVDQDNYKLSRRATYDDAFWSYPLTEQVFELGIPYSQYQKVAIDQASESALISSSLATIDSSKNAWDYAVARDALGKVAAKAIAAGLTEVVGDDDSWTETETEDFILKAKKMVTKAKAMNDHNVQGHTCAGAPSLTLYVKQGVEDTMAVKSLAGAINRGDLAIPATVKTILDFGADGDNIVAVLCDPRIIKIHDDINEFESVALGFQINMKRHIKQTVFVSNYGFIHVFTKA